ncbi:MAG: phosphoribosylglycinamide formyltransferase [Vicinamibacteria bacterium]|nr:phosphoribosylglycinamide formyltransferase [Vicinamibacteria bacterium]
MKRLGVLLSGRGSNFRALLAATREGRLAAEIAVVVSNVSDAPGLAHARAAGLPAFFFDHRGRTRDEHDAEVGRVLAAHAADLVCLAGYMRLLGRAFVEAHAHRVVNIHPSLLPAFPGRAAQRQALDYGVRVTGATVHLVDAGLDTGPIVAQRTVPVEAGDTEESLSERILALEHQLYPEAVERLTSETWRIEGRRLIFLAR